MNMKNIVRLQLIVTGLIFAVLSHEMYLNGYDRLQNFNKILQLQHFWIHLVVVFSCAMTSFLGAYMCLFSVAGILAIPDIPWKKRLFVILITLLEFCFLGLCSSWLWLVWVPNILVDFTSCITYSTLVASMLVVAYSTINMVLQRTEFSRIYPIPSWNINQILQILLIIFFGVPMSCLITFLVFIGFILSGLWLLFYLSAIIFLLFNMRFDRLIEFGKHRVLHCSLLYSVS
jgi:hypothetical protein